MSIADVLPVGGADAAAAVMAIAEVGYLEGEPETYVLPLAVLTGDRAERFAEESPTA